jgi:hypothetical protein
VQDPALFDLARRLYGSLLPIHESLLVSPGSVSWTDDDIEALLRLAAVHGNEPEAIAQAARHGLLAIRAIVERPGVEQSLPRGIFGSLERRRLVAAGQDMEATLLETQRQHLGRTRNALEALINLAEKAAPRSVDLPWWRRVWRRASW